jgi:hypothetical protein
LARAPIFMRHRVRPGTHEVLVRKAGWRHRMAEAPIDFKVYLLDEPFHFTRIIERVADPAISQKELQLVSARGGCLQAR